MMCHPWSGDARGSGALRTTPLLVAVAFVVTTMGASVTARHGMVVASEPQAATVGREMLRVGGSAVDAAVATAFALAVTYPRAGNIGGGGFIVYRPTIGSPFEYDFRETTPARASSEMFLFDGVYDRGRHHASHLAVGVPGTVAKLHLAWSEHGWLPWRRVVEPAIDLAR
jgi:gamma-glutamyltranspeptidase/glutathione hydrolase